jgi:hypothetical protein
MNATLHNANFPLPCSYRKKGKARSRIIFSGFVRPEVDGVNERLHEQEWRGGRNLCYIYSEGNRMTCQSKRD